MADVINGVAYLSPRGASKYRGQHAETFTALCFTSSDLNRNVYTPPPLHLHWVSKMFSYWTIIKTSQSGPVKHFTWTCCTSLDYGASLKLFSVHLISVCPFCFPKAKIICTLEYSIYFSVVLNENRSSASWARWILVMQIGRSLTHA